MNGFLKFPVNFRVSRELRELLELLVGGRGHSEGAVMKPAS